jgi:hypothetical protein
MCSIQKQGNFVVGYVDNIPLIRSPIDDFRIISILNKSVVMVHKNGMTFRWQLKTNDSKLSLIYTIDDSEPKIIYVDKNNIVPFTY